MKGVLGTAAFVCLATAAFGCGEGSERYGTTPVGDDGTAGLGAEIDVLVIGGGPSGMAAAIEAAERGAHVVLLEKQATLCNGGACDVAKMLFSGSPEQAALGVEDSPALLLDEWSALTGGDPGSPWVRAYAERNVPDVRDWLTDLGAVVSIPVVEEDPGGSSTHRDHLVAALGPTLEDRLEELIAPEDILLSHEVTGLVLDDDGLVLGAAYTDHHTGTTGWLEARTTIVATGGFLRNLDKVRTYRPDLEGVGLWFDCMPGADGSGHTMLEEVAAVIANPSAQALHVTGLPDPLHPGELTDGGAMREAIWVNGAGARFTDETSLDMFGPAEDVVDQPDGLAWVVMDEVLAAEGALYEIQEDGNTLLIALLDAGLAASDLTLSALGQGLGFDDEVFTATVGDYNRYAAGDAEDGWRSGEEAPPPIATPPFHAIRLPPATAKSFGGIAVDLDGRVLDGGGNPVPGLLAAGELTGMAGGSLVGDRPFEGSVSAVLLSGRVAGATAAADAAAGSR